MHVMHEDHVVSRHLRCVCPCRLATRARMEYTIIFAVLLVLCVCVQWYSRQYTGSNQARSVTDNHAFAAFQKNYLIVYFLVMGNTQSFQGFFFLFPDLISRIGLVAGTLCVQALPVLQFFNSWNWAAVYCWFLVIRCVWNIHRFVCWQIVRKNIISLEILFYIS